MGEAGLISRVLAKKFGAFLTFASLDDAGGTAPGQVTIDDMKRLYRWDAIGPTTKVYGVVGSPVAHSMSPAIHNAAFDETGYDGVYLPLLVNAGYESFKAFMESFRRRSRRWTCRACRSRSRTRKTPCGTCGKRARRSTRWRRASARSTRSSSTAPAAAEAARHQAPTTPPSSTASRRSWASPATTWPNYRVAVLGAGGTGRTAVAALAHYGATVVVYNRTRERADALAAEFNGQARQGRRGPDGKALRQLLPDLHQHDVGRHAPRTSTPAPSAIAPRSSRPTRWCSTPSTTR